jgi:hypothetical protein
MDAAAYLEESVGCRIHWLARVLTWLAHALHEPSRGYRAQGTPMRPGCRCRGWCGWEDCWTALYSAVVPAGHTDTFASLGRLAVTPAR